MKAPTELKVTTDLIALKARRQSACGTGDYAVVGTNLQIVGELLAEACDLKTDERVLEIASVNGNATLADPEALPFADASFDGIAR